MNNPTVDVDIPGIVSVDMDNPLERVEVMVTGSAYLEGLVLEGGLSKTP